MVLGVLTALLPAMTAETPVAPKMADPAKMDIGPQIRSEQVDMNEVRSSAVAQGGVAGKQVFNDFYAVGDSEWFYTGGYGGGFVPFEKRGEQEYCEVWVALDLSFPAGDPRNAFTSRITITDDQVNYIMDEFDTTIYTNESNYFATPPPLDGTNSLFEEWGYPYMNTSDAGKAMIMIFNIRDANYDDPGYPYYIVGFFSPSIKLYYDRNIIHIDCWDWENRTTGTSARPWVYESTVAHEWQHLLHDATDWDESTWLNEGCAMYAEFLCGYGIDPGYINSYLYTQDNSLTVWGDQGDINILADYGVAAMFMMYLNDQFGGAETITALFHNENNSGLSVTEALVAQGYTDWDFDSVFHAWTLANLIRSDNPGGGLYNYDSIDLNSPDIIPSWYGAWWYNPYAGYISHASWFGDTYTYLGYSTDVSTIGSYGARDYYVTAGNNWRDMDPLGLRFEFDGWDHSWTGWSNVYDMWYSGYGDERDVSLMGTADLTGMETATLTFDTWYDIEEFWDFGFVQVSNDSGATWISLANEYTVNETDPSAMPAIVANIPGLTGYSGGWVTMSFDLSEYAGQEVMLKFRYMTDWGTYYEGWYVDDVYINDELIDNGQDVIGLSVVYPDADYMITVYAPGQWTEDGQYLLPLLFEVDVTHGPETASRSFSSLSMYDAFYIVISTTAGPVDYSFGTVNWGI
jgi:hypothetical protein